MGLCSESQAVALQSFGWVTFHMQQQLMQCTKAGVIPLSFD